MSGEYRPKGMCRYCMNKMNHGIFITLEGIDGCGKSTQARMLADYFEDHQRQVSLTREPGGTPLAEEIRRVILTPSEEELDPTAEIFLYSAARAQHVQTFVKPALKQGNIVVCERFVDSSLAYQGYGLGRDKDLIREISRLAVGDLTPDLTILLDLPTDLAYRRVNGRSVHRGDRIEQRGLRFQEKVRQGFLDLARRESRIVMIDTADKTIADVHREVVALFKRRFPRFEKNAKGAEA